MPTARDYERRGYRAWVLALLTAGCALNFLDRQLVVILQEPIKQEFGLSDTQLGLLSGFGFAAIYVVCGVFVALWSETRARRGVIALAIGTWSVMTALFGMAQGYGQLLLARMGVAVGESGGGPPSHSLISDLYPPERRGMALAIYTSGVNIGILLGFLLGGWLNELHGWRTAFFVLGLPGVLLALVVRLTVAEPVRGAQDPGSLATAAARPRLGAALRVLWSSTSFRWLSLGSAFQAFALYGIGAWYPSYLIRGFGMGTAEVGTWLALLAGGVGAIGTLAGGWFGDRLARRDARWYLWLPLACGLLGLPFATAMFLVDDARLSLALNAVPMLLNFVYLPPVLAAAHRLVDARLRATTSAVLFFVINLIGMGGGPVFVGAMSDALAPAMGADALRSAILCALAVSGVVSTVAYLRGAARLREELAGERAGLHA